MGFEVGMKFISENDSSIFANCRASRTPRSTSSMTMPQVKNSKSSPASAK